jgi:hypothetical protein
MLGQQTVLQAHGAQGQSQRQGHVPVGEGRRAQVQVAPIALVERSTGPDCAAREKSIEGGCSQSRLSSLAQRSRVQRGRQRRASSNHRIQDQSVSLR